MQKKKKTVSVSTVTKAVTQRKDTYIITRSKRSTILLCMIILKSNPIFYLTQSNKIKPFCYPWNPYVVTQSKPQKPPCRSYLT